VVWFVSDDLTPVTVSIQDAYGNKWEYKITLPQQ
jgi:hypothetical protein